MQDRSMLSQLLPRPLNLRQSPPTPKTATHHPPPDFPISFHILPLGITTLLSPIYTAFNWLKLIPSPSGYPGMVLSMISQVHVSEECHVPFL